MQCPASEHTVFNALCGLFWCWRPRLVKVVTVAFITPSVLYGSLAISFFIENTFNFMCVTKQSDQPTKVSVELNLFVTKPMSIWPRFLILLVSAHLCVCV